MNFMWKQGEEQFTKSKRKNKGLCPLVNSCLVEVSSKIWMSYKHRRYNFILGRPETKKMSLFGLCLRFRLGLCFSPVSLHCVCHDI